MEASGELRLLWALASLEPQDGYGGFRVVGVFIRIGVYGLGF